MVIWEPTIDRGTLRIELRRFPYLSDKNRNDAGIDRLIDDLYGANVTVEYSDGLMAFRMTSDDTADVFWVHLDGHRLSHKHVRAARTLMEAAMKELKLRAITMTTADNRVARLAGTLGFKLFKTEEDGFEWEGMRIPRYHLAKED